MWTIKTSTCIAVRLAGARRCSSQLPGRALRREFKVVLDNETLYIEQTLAEALGWKPGEESKDGPVSLTLSGWSPHYFAIAKTGTNSDLLARRTVESSRNPRVQEVLAYLKDR